MKGLIYTYGMTALGAAASIFYPLVGLMIFINFAIVQPSSMWYWSVPQYNYSRILAIAVGIGWLIKGFGNWRLGRSMPVVLALSGFFLWCCLGYAACDYPPVAEGFVVSLAKILFPFLVGITLINDVPKLKVLGWTLALSQGYVAYEMNLSYYAGVNRVATVGFAGMDNNYVAVAMVTGAGLAFFLGLGERRIWLKAIAFLAAVLMAHTVMFSWSRGGMLGLIVTAVVGFLLVVKKPTHFVFFVLILLVGLRLAGPQVRQRFSSVFVDPAERDRSASSRLESWAACWDVMYKQPVLGVGPNHWPIRAGAYGHPGVEAHSLWLQTGAELGFPGLIFLLCFYGFCMIRLWPLTRKKTPVADPWLRDVARMVIASLVGFGVAGQFVSISGLELPYYIVLFGAGALKLNSMAARPAPAPLAAPARAAPREPEAAAV